MKLAALVLVVSAPAWADPAERCTAGVAAAKKGDLSHAALYLDGCDDAQLPAELAADVARATRDVRKKLESSELSVLEVVTRPAGISAEVDALPGEQLTTPVTLYIPAGTHQVRAGTVTSSITTKPHARSVVYLDANVPAAAPPKDGKLDFNEDSGGEATPEVVQPKDQNHPSLVPCRYSNSCSEAGGQLDDPLARHETPPRRFPQLSVQLLGGAAYADALDASFGTAVRLRLQDVEHPFFVWGHADVIAGHDHDELAITAAAGKVIAAPDTAWLSIGLGATYDTYYGAAGTALVELALRRLPVVLGARYEQIVEGMHEHVFGLEAGFALGLL